ncbi:YebF family protein [Serratia rhizosphaerae]
MNLNRKFSVLIIIAIAICVYFITPLKGSGCGKYSRNDAVSVISKDFLVDRMERWNAESEFLGTNKPKLNFSLSKVKQERVVYSVPFSASGPNGKRDYIGILDCNNDTVEYSVR